MRVRIWDVSAANLTWSKFHHIHYLQIPPWLDFVMVGICWETIEIIIIIWSSWRSWSCCPVVFGTRAIQVLQPGSQRHSLAGSDEDCLQTCVFMNPGLFSDPRGLFLLHSSSLCLILKKTKRRFGVIDKRKNIWSIVPSKKNEVYIYNLWNMGWIG